MCEIKHLTAACSFGRRIKLKNRIELLSPAGSYESFRAALGAGADAVYAGGELFGARAYAHNFNREELIRAIREAHVLDKKLYLTVNTLVKNVEMERHLYEYLKPFYEEGLDAVLVQDFGVLSFIREYFPALPIHASTQMTVTGAAGMRFLEKLGVTRVVPARELSLDELKEMHASSSLEIETFLHGALCYCYSGRCLMSSIFGGRSGNRGKCAQPCRLPFSRDGKKTDQCLLSMKDLCGADLIPELIEAGIASLKIEGRMKQPDYVAGVTAVYRDCIDRYDSCGREGYRVLEEERQLLKDLFSRGGFTSGYFHRHNGKDMMSFRNEKKSVPRDISIRKPERAVTLNAVFRKGEPAELTMNAGDLSCTVKGAPVLEAYGTPMDKERIKGQLAKLGNTPFCAENVEVTADAAVFLPVKDLNSLRREAAGRLESLLADGFRRTAPAGPQKRNAWKTEADPQEERSAPPRFHISCRNPALARVLAQSGMEEIRSFYLPFDGMKEFLRNGYAKQYDLYLMFPEITRGCPPEGFLETAEKWLKEGMRGFLVKDLEAYALLCERGLQDRCVIDASLYTWNDRAVQFFLDRQAVRITAPLELNEKELSHRNFQKGEILIYGRIPLMISAQCVKRNTGACNGKEERLKISDRTRRDFPVLCVCDPWKTGNTPAASCCYNIIYNNVALGLFREAKRVAKTGFGDLRMDFTIESQEEALFVLREAKACFVNGRIPQDRREMTGGHFNRGAE